MLAEEDLKMRGPGKFFGTRQSGLPDLKVADLTDYLLIVHTREVTEAILGEDPTLSSEKYSALANYVRQRHIMWCSNVYSVVFSKSIYLHIRNVYTTIAIGHVVELQCLVSGCVQTGVGTTWENSVISKFRTLPHFWQHTQLFTI